MWNNKRGAALMQVLLMSMILAGMATMLLRASLSRTVSARKTRRSVSAAMLIESCMAEVNAFWVAKSPLAYLRDLQMDENAPYMYCAEVNDDNSCKTPVSTYTCSINNPYDADHPYTVEARFDSNGQIVYEVKEGSDIL